MTKRTTLAVALLFIIQISGFVLLWQKMPNPENVVVVPNSATGANAASGVSAVAVKLPDTELLRETVRQVVQEELHAIYKK